MPKREITIEEAFAAFAKHGLKVKVEGIIEEELSTAKEPDSGIIVRKPIMYGKSSPTFNQKLVKITLRAKHSIGSGGSLVGAGNEAQPVDCGNETYGPGVCYVKPEIAEHLLYQDALAIKADERFLDRTQRTFVVGSIRTAMGGVAHVGVETTPDTFADFVNPYTDAARHTSLGRI